MASKFDINQLRNDVPIVDPVTGKPTEYFLRLLFGNTGATQGQQQTVEELFEEVQDLAEDLGDKVDKSTTISAGPGLDGGGDLSQDRTISLNADLDDLNDVDLGVPPTDGQVLGYVGSDGTWQPVDQSGGGGGEGVPEAPVDGTTYGRKDAGWAPVTGGGGGGFFTGATTDGIPSASTSSYATKGLVFQPYENISVKRLYGFIDAAASANSYYFQIASLKDVVLGSPDFHLVMGLQVDTVLGTTPSVVAGSTDMRKLSASLTNTVSLTAGTYYIVVAVFDQNSGTGTARVSTGVSTSSGGWELNAPVTTLLGSPQFNTVGLTSGQAPSTVGTGYYSLCIEGTM